MCTCQLLHRGHTLITCQALNVACATDAVLHICQPEQMTRPLGCPRSIFNEVAMPDCKPRRITKTYRGAQIRLLWRERICLARI